MKPLSQILTDYQNYHTKPITRATHMLGVPLIVFAILLFLSWFSFSLNPILNIPLVWFAISAAAIYYIRLDWQLGLILSLVYIIFTLISGISFHYQFSKSAFITFSILFSGGWLIQLLGHLFEAKRPAFMHNVSHIFAAPLFVIAEILLKLNKRQDLKQYLNYSDNSPQSQLSERPR